jgi:NAD+ kinase
MKNFRIFANPDPKSQEVKAEVNRLLAAAGFSKGNANAEFCIAIGGDGTFLKMVRDCSFDGNAKFVGINTGTLGYLQDFNAEQIKSFTDMLINDKYWEQTLSFISAYIEHGDTGLSYDCLNEIVIRDADLRTINLGITVDEEEFEHFAGDGVLVASSMGSTAHNLSNHGSIVPIDFHTLQLTPIAPINTPAYRSLTKSVIMPSRSEIVITPEGRTKTMLVIADGQVIINDAKSVRIRLSENRITTLVPAGHSIWRKIRTKLLVNR